MIHDRRDPEYPHAWLAACIEAHRQFEEGEMSQPIYRATLYSLGFRGQEIESEIHLHWPMD